MTPEEIEAKKRQVFEMVGQTRELVNVRDVPFALKQKIVRLLVDEIILNLDEEWFEIRGMVGAFIYGLNDTTKRMSVPLHQRSLSNHPG